MKDKERYEFYRLEGKQHSDCVMEDNSELCIANPYKLDMLRWQYATQQFIKKNLNRISDEGAQNLTRLKLLDVGVQDGPFSLGWVTMGFDVTGVDISEHYVEVAKNSIAKFACHDDWRIINCDIILDITELKKYAPFDVISALEVVEHLPDIEQFLDVAAGLAGDGSLLVISVPGDDSWSSDPGHLHSFWKNEDDIRKDNRIPHIFPRCFKNKYWNILSTSRQQWNEEEFWYAITLRRSDFCVD